MSRTLFAVCLVIAIFVGFEAGYSLAPFVQAGVFAPRREKGVESKIDERMQRYYQHLYDRDE